MLGDGAEMGWAREGKDGIKEVGRGVVGKEKEENKCKSGREGRRVHEGKEDRKHIIIQGRRKQKETCPANVQLHCRRQCQRRVKIFLHFSVIRMGSRGTWVLCTASSRCTRITGPGGNETTDSLER